MAYPLDRDQWSTLSRILARARRAGASRTEVVAAVETGLTEANLRNPTGPPTDHDSLGWRQERQMYYPNPTNIEASADRYFRETRAYMRRHGRVLPSVLSQGVQRSAYPERYAQKGAAARAILAEAKRRGLYVGPGTGGGKPQAPSETKTKTVPGTPSQTVVTDPGEDNSMARKQLLLNFVANRGKPGRTQEFAMNWLNAQDRPKQQITIPGQPAQTVQTPGKPKTKQPTGKGGKFNPGPAWGGSQGVINPARRIARQLGFSTSSLKRSDDPSGIGAASDHHVANRAGFAADFPATGARGDQLARAIAREYGIPTRNIGTFNRHTITAANGQRYSVQLLWRVANHYDHVHFGVRRA
jgi:hypothetical protein